MILLARIVTVCYILLRRIIMAAKELADLLKQRAKDDAVYRLACEIANLHAVQGRNDSHTKLKAQTVSEVADTKKTEGTQSDGIAIKSNRGRTSRSDKERQVKTKRF